MDAKPPSLDNQKKANLYVYKFSPISIPGGRTLENQPQVTKKIIFGNIWSLRKSSKSLKLKPKSDQEEVVRSCKEEPKVIKAVSSLEVGMRVFEGGRKSLSHVENRKKYVGKIEEKLTRKSTGAKLEKNNKNVESVIELLQVKVLVSDMPGFMQVHASQCARKTYDSLEKFSAKHLAFNLKKEFDKVYGPAWHCIVGSSFGSFVTHATGCFLYLSMEKLCVLLFRTKVLRALHQ